MTSGAAQAAAREGLGLPPGGSLSDVLARAALLPSDWGGQDVVAAWARGGPEDATEVARAVATGTAERVWGPHGRLWLTAPDVAAQIRVVYRHLEERLTVDEALARRLREAWPAGMCLTVGRAAGLLGRSREEVGPAVQLGCLRGWWRPGPRDDEGRIAFEVREGRPAAWARDEACARLVARLVEAMGVCTVEAVRARLGPEVPVEVGAREAVVAGWLTPDGDRLAPNAEALRPAVGGLAILGRGDPFAVVVGTTPATEPIRRAADPPPLVVIDGQLAGVWSERWVGRSLHLDVAVKGTFEGGHGPVLAERIASFGRLRGARRTRWRTLIGDLAERSLADDQ